MATRELLVPLLLGAIVTGGMLLWAPSEVSLPAPVVATADIDTPYVLLPRAVEDDGTTLLHFGDGGRHPIGGPLDVHAGTVHNGSFQWSGADWACLRAPAAPCSPTGNASSKAPIPLLPATANGTVDPSGVVEVTFYMFTTNGRLIATNDVRSNWENFTLHGDFTPVSAKRWFLGPGDAPPGATKLPAFRAETSAILAGTPVGGVRTSVLETHAYDDLVDELWITARVEGAYSGTTGSPS